MNVQIKNFDKFDYNNKIKMFGTYVFQVEIDHLKTFNVSGAFYPNPIDTSVGFPQKYFPNPKELKIS